MKKQNIIRLFRFGRKHLPIYRLGVSPGYVHPSKKSAQDYIGSYDPKTKKLNVNKNKLERYLKLNIELSSTVESILKKNKLI